jgi:anti-sigma B factor antagonist
VEAVSLVTRTDVVDGSAVVSVTGDVDLMSAPHLREAMEEALGRSPHLIVDVAEMTFIDSSGLSALVHAHRQAADAGGSMTVRRPSPTLKRLLSITHLETVLVVDDAETGPSPTGRSTTGAEA